MSLIKTLFHRELMGYFRTPVAYVFLAVFVLSASGLPWFLGGFFESNDASLQTFFKFIPWVYLFLIPAVGMRLWSEEKRTGTIELLLTYPITRTQAVLGKFLAGWAFIAIALVLTFGMPLTVDYLGAPDWGQMLCGYFACLLMAGTYLSLCQFISALTRSQVVSFVVSALLCLIFVLLGWSLFNDLLLMLGFSVSVVDALANLSFMTHFSSMSEGLVTLNDLLFFISTTAFFLALNVMVIESASARKLRNTSALLIFLILANILASSLSLQIDLTENRIYTLYSKSKHLLLKLHEPVTVNFYYSKSTPGMPVLFKNYASRVERLLHRYSESSQGMLKVNTIDPKPDTTKENDAFEAGISLRKTPSGEGFFFGIDAVQGEKHATLPLLLPERESLLEYDITRLIYSLHQQRKPTVAVLTSLPLFGTHTKHTALTENTPAPNRWALIRELEELYHLEPMRRTIPEEADLLLIIHPRTVTTDLSYDIDQFAMSGKPVIIAVDPASLYALSRPSARISPQSGEQLLKLFKGWGIQYNPREMLIDSTLAYSTSNASAPNPSILDVRSIQPDHLATHALEQVLLPVAGAFNFDLAQDAKLLPLMISSPQSNFIPSVLAQEATPEQLSFQLMPDGQRKALAALIEGKLPSAYPEGRPIDPDSPTALADEFNAAEEGTMPIPEDSVHIALIADTDFIIDSVALRNASSSIPVPANDNLAFMANLIDSMLDNDTLPALRSKDSSLRPFTVVEGMVAQAHQKFKERTEEIQQQLEQVQHKINQAYRTDGKEGQIITTENIQEKLSRFRAEEARLNQSLREVRKSLREGVEQLKFTLALANLLIVPLGLLIFSSAYFSRRNRPRA